MNKQRTQIKATFASKRFPELVLVITFLLSAFVTWHMTGRFLDSDASSELVLAKHLSQTGQILSRDWFYSTELRVLNTQLVYAPLFLLFEDWHMVRFAGAILLQILYIASYGFVMKQARVDRGVICGSACLLLLPVSVNYGRILLYHGYYIPHIILSFVLTGLLLDLCREGSRRRKWSCGGLLILLSFIGGLGGVRQLMITHAPLLAVAMVCILMELRIPGENGKAQARPEMLRLLLWGLAGAAASFVGLKVNTGLLSKLFSFTDQSVAVLAITDGSAWDDIAYGFFHQFGFRTGVPMLSLLGILSLAGVLAAGVCVFLSVRWARCYTQKEEPEKTVLSTMFTWYVAVMAAVFVFAGEGYHYHLYLTFCIPWAVPVLAVKVSQWRTKSAAALTEKLFVMLTAAVLVANGLANCAFFCGAETFDQRYEGLGFREKDKAQQLEGPVRFLLEEGFDMGYATFWEGNILTELSDGALPMVNIQCDEEWGYADCHYHDWLTSRYQREVEAQRPFVLLDITSREVFQETDSVQVCRLVYEDEDHCIYEILDQQQFDFMLNY